jgi:hypothetical protein
MKNKLITRFLITVVGIISIALSTTNAFAATNSETVVSPFWQSDGSVYTFIAASHSSLTGMNSQIGVVVNALTVTGSSFGSTEFTVGENDTTRVFIVATNHTQVNSLTVTSSEDIFITGTTNLSSGQVRITSQATDPLAEAFGGFGQGTPGLRKRDVTMLSFWGSVVIPGTNTGFAMEFIGDTHDSVFAVTTPQGQSPMQPLKGIGIN